MEDGTGLGKCTKFLVGGTNLNLDHIYSYTWSNLFYAYGPHWPIGRDKSYSSHKGESRFRIEYQRTIQHMMP